jgi:hypothetical protein
LREFKSERSRERERYQEREREREREDCESGRVREDENLRCSHRGRYQSVVRQEETNSEGP